MNDPLSEKEHETVERIRKKEYRDPLPIQDPAKVWEQNFFNLLGDASDLLYIIDSISQRGGKKFAIESLQDHPEYGDGLKYVPDYRYGFSDALRYLGALEEK